MTPESTPQETASLHAQPDPRDAAGLLRRRVDKIPKQIGHYKLLEQIGEGGMGVVYLAEQSKPIHRRVALKIIKLGMDTRQVIARFEAEREALALMDHPNVARVLDAGTTETGRPYFVMEHVPGVPITDYADRHRLSTRDRLLLFVDVCHAVQHAHQKGIIHRDLKPSNVLVSLLNGKPVAKVIDFGVAKATQQRLTEQTLFTEHGQLIGTPGYMSPEQAEMTGLDIDTRTDIYALGVLLYELLVGALPFDAESLRRAGLGEIQRIIREVDPPRPSTKLSSLRLAAEGPSESDLRSKIDAIAKRRGTEARTLVRQLRGDLDWIVMKCLEKDRTRRYDTANGLAMEIGRYLNNEPVLAGPPGAGYRVRKFVRRNRPAVLAACLVVATLLAGLAGTSWGVVWALREAAEARAERDKAQLISDFMNTTLEGVDPGVARGRDSTLLREMMDGAAARITAGKLAHSPEAELRLRLTIGNVYHAVDALDDAEAIFRAALDLARRIHSQDHADLATSIHFLGWLLIAKGDYEHGEPLCREALDMRRRVLGDAHVDVAHSLNDCGVIREHLGHMAEAEALHRQALDMRRKLLGNEHPDVWRSLTNLGEVYTKTGDYDQAEQMYKSALALAKKLYGPAHPDSARSLNDVGKIALRKGRLAEAQQLFEESLSLRRRLYGDESFAVAESYVQLGGLRSQEGSYAIAEGLYREALAIEQRLRGAKSAFASLRLLDLGAVLWRQGKHEEAERVLREAREIQLGYPAEKNVELADINSRLAPVLVDTGRYDEAAELVREALAIKRDALGEEHLDVASLLCSSAVIHERKRDRTAAEQLARQAVEMDRRLDKVGMRTSGHLQYLGGLLYRCDKPAEAEPALQEAFDLQRRLRGADHPGVAECEIALARVAIRRERFTEGEQLAQDSLRIYDSCPDEPAWRRADARSALGEALVGLGRFAEAEALLLEAWVVLRDCAIVAPWIKRDALTALGALYGKWHALDQSQDYDRKAAEYLSTRDAHDAVSR